MRSPILPMRQAGRICDACRQVRSHSRSPAMLSLSSSSLHSGSSAAPARTRMISSTAAAPTTQRIPRHCTIHARQFSSSATLRQPSQPQPSPTYQEQPQQQQPPSASEGQEAVAADGKEGGGGVAEKQKKTYVSHYDFFPKTLPQGPPPRGPFAIDTRALRREFLALQGAAHPDLHPPGHLKARAEAASARINEAYRTLSGPLPRAQHLLALRGAADAAADEAAKVEDPELLMLVLETREAIEEAGAEEELEPLRVENERRIGESEEVLERAFAEDDLETAAREVVRLRYWVNIAECIRNWERGKPVVLEH
ncbi:Co-chaperone Hsc20 [Camillea tinctor]|nr:Co-chaperone Hsc20 [Camillea tinctor]